MIEMDCTCVQKHHSIPTEVIEVSDHAIEKVGDILKDYRRIFMVADENTYRVAGQRVEEILKEQGILSHTLVLPSPALPNAESIGKVLMEAGRDREVYDINAWSLNPDYILAVGSGSLNDTCRMVSYRLGIPYGVVGTAPSMDGYASNSSSMELNHVKVSLYNHGPEGILLDSDILAQAPMRMLWAGLGDMVAKYLAVCEWRISHLVTGEYYCEDVAELMRAALRKVMAGADGIADRDVDAIQSIAEGLVVAGIGMAYAEISRPASGLEHYFSHMWEMMALERGVPYDLHGIQVGVGTLLTMKICRKLLAEVTPDRARAEAAMAAFDPAAWEAQVRRIFGKTADQILAIEAKTHKNDPARHARRLDNIVAHWDEICGIVREELPDYDALHRVMAATGMPLTPGDIGLPVQDVVDAFVGARDIRDKYLFCSLIWDLGLTDAFARYVGEVAEE